ncbi:hypothetical protein FZEAL_1338 [Fusarium zealandicum]|uniref:Uncharacterized protein n=1 Tax=Fusarium zealandicum TaxID=1053134 RepID=A0A8H4USX2_9HYPO|nr:hypothetical protein FZEAL_1338 [Fusarium zealandicum]
MMNLNLSASLNITRLLFKPSLCLPHHTVSTFNELPIPLEKGLQKEGRKVEIRAVVLDKDDCFAYPDSIEVYGSYKTHFEKLKQAYPGRKLLVVSNTAGATSWDKNLKLASEVENNTGIPVLPHAVKKPGCGEELMEYFKRHPETGVTDPAHIAFVGDRLTTDMMLANMTGGWGFWVRDGVIPLAKKSVVWSVEEERVFWEVVIPRSPGAANPNDRTLTWKECVDVMKDSIGESSRRDYTYTMLYEHHYQNFKPGAKSPKANQFLEKYMRDIDWYQTHTSPPPASPPRASALDDPVLAALLEKDAKSRAHPPRKTTQPHKPTQRRVRRAPSMPTLPYRDESEDDKRGRTTTRELRPRSPAPINQDLPQYATRPQSRADAKEHNPDHGYQRQVMDTEQTGARPYLGQRMESLEDGAWRLTPRTPYTGGHRGYSSLRPANLPFNRQPYNPGYDGPSASANRRLLGRMPEETDRP